jgi:hypothetical protein
VAGHRPARFPRVSGQQCLDNGQVLPGFLGQPVIIIAGLVVLPGHVPEGPKKNLQAAQLLGQEGIVARVSDQIVKAAVQVPGLSYKLGS